MKDFQKVLPESASVVASATGEHLAIGGIDTAELAAEYGTPLFVLCEQTFRNRLGAYCDAFGADNVFYASKAFLTSTLVPLLGDAGIDCASGGELYAALAGGMFAERIVLHGNNKSEDELAQAVDAGVGRIVVDAHEELEMLDRVAGSRLKEVKALLRITPGIEAHTHEYLKTGIEDTKFGLPIGNTALEAVAKASAASNVELVGIHCHIGSQILDLEPFAEAAKVMLAFLDDARRVSGLPMPELDMGGGLGIRYTPDDDPPTVSELGRVLRDVVGDRAVVKVEPGRSVAGPSMVTLYTSGVVKDIPGVRRYVSVDGGMSDNIRPALYGAGYTFLSATRPETPHTVPYAVAGKLCESGDILSREALLPELLPGELICVPATGAYGYAMASVYNRLPRPAVIAVKDGDARVLARRETYEDLIRLER